MAFGGSGQDLDSRSFQPTARLAMLRLRSELLAYTRGFFAVRRYLEVETPLLSHDVVVDAHLDPFVTRADSETSSAAARPADELFLQTSPEFGMKRLLASGATAIFQITRAFRRGELGRYHNPEFTIVEWYRVDDSYRGQMELVEELVAGCFELVQSRSSQESIGAAIPGTALRRPFERSSYDAAFQMAVGHPVIGRSAAELATVAKQLGVHAPASLAADEVDGWLNLLLAMVVEPLLARRQAVFLYDFPPGQSALARIRSGSPDVAERFELYLSGIEICNGYQELTDADELRRRIDAQARLRHREGLRPLPAQSRLLEAMDAGLPPCAGVALGFDRLLMAATGARSLDAVMPFPFRSA